MNKTHLSNYFKLPLYQQYYNRINHIPNFYYVNYPHYLSIKNNLTNDFNETTITPPELIETYSSTHPIPIFYNENEIINNDTDNEDDDEIDNKLNVPSVFKTRKYNDIVINDLLKQHNNVEHLKFIKSNYKKHMKNKSELSKNLQNENIYHKSIVKSSKLIFTTNKYQTYDWYWSGNGCLLNYKDNLLFHVNNNDMTTLKFSKIEEINTNNKIIMPQFSIDFSQDNEIYEIKKLLNSNLIGVRQKNKLKLYNSTDDIITENNFIQIADISFNKPIIGYAFEQNKNLLITTNIHGVIRIWDLSQLNKHIKQYNIQSSSSTTTDDLSEKRLGDWNTIKYYKKNTFTFVNRNMLNIIDIRSSHKQCNRLSFQNQFQDCEEITSYENSTETTLSYIGTTHKLYAIDLRYCKSSSSTNKSLVILQWDHQLKSSAVYMNLINNINEDGEHILISSQLPDDIKLCDVKKFNKNYQSINLPYSPVTISKAIDNLKFNGYGLNPLINLNRLNLCITGQMLKYNLSKQNDEEDNNNQQIELILQNSCGDLFFQQIGKNQFHEKIKNPHHTIFFNLWDKYFDSLKKLSKFNCSDAINFNALIDTLKTVSISTLPGKSTTINTTIAEATASNIIIDGEPAIGTQKLTNEKFKLKKPRHWQKSIETLKKCTDALAADMLSIWDLDDVQIKTDDNEDDKSKINLVDNWLQTQTDQQHENPNNSCIELFEPINDTNNDDTINDILFYTSQLSQSQSQSQSQPKRRKINKNISVPGF